VRLTGETKAEAKIVKWFVHLIVAAALMGAPALAEDYDVFKDGADGAKVHVASGFVCPLEVGRFDRDAVGERRPAVGSDYCAYSGRDGVYGTIVVMPMHGEFDPKAVMADDFVVQEGTGGKMASESTLNLGPTQALSVYARIYDAAKIEAMKYRTLFACAAVGGWVVEVVVEYADPRDTDAKNEFVKAVYDSALKKLGGEPG
jgi:hypothetical protein